MAPMAELSRVFGQNGEPISRTMQYRKITKPLLERQRRARINRCLDELKDILVTGLQSEGESVSRLEKADILELTVRHLQKMQMTQESLERNIEEEFKQGFASCAHEVSRTLAMTRGVDITLGSSLMIHLGKSLNTLNRVPRVHSSSKYSDMTPPSSPSSMTSSSPSCSPRERYSYSPISEPASPQSLHSPYNLSMSSISSVWRPW